MNKPLVSVIIPVYNAQKYLSQTVESVLNQSYENIEIIIIDDSSIDNSFQLAKSFRNEKITSITQKNTGAAIARNTGLKLANGKYIQFLDADDRLSPHKIELQVKALNECENKVAVCDYISFFDDDEISNLKGKDQSTFIYSSDDPLDFLVTLWGGKGKSNFIQTNSWLVPLKLIEAANYWREYRCPDDDGEFFTRLLLKSKGIVYVPNAINYYRRFLSETNLSQQVSFSALKNSLLTIDLKYQYCLKAGKHELLDKAISRQYLNFAVYNYLNNKKLSKIAYRRYRNFRIKLSPPKIGGYAVEVMKKIVGWKLTLIISNRIKKFFYLNK